MNDLLLYLSLYYFLVEIKELEDIDIDDALINEIKNTFLKSPFDRPTMETVSSAVGMLSIDLCYTLVLDQCVLTFRQDLKTPQHVFLWW